MSRIEAVWTALGNLTYADLMNLACDLRDTWRENGGSLEDARDWAECIDNARAFAVQAIQEQQP